MKTLCTLLLVVAAAPGCDDDDAVDDAADADSDSDSDADFDTDSDSNADPPIGDPGTFDESLDVDGVSRTYTLHVPESATDAMIDGPVPLLFALHGAGDTGANFIAATELAALASSEAFVVAGPDGFNAGWFVQENEGWPGADGNEMSLQNDAQLVLDILAATSADYPIDPTRIFAVGHSRGAAFTALLATLSGQMPIASGTYESPFAAFGVNAGYDPTQGQIEFGDATPKAPIWVIHGTTDGVVPFSQGEDLAEALDAAGWDAIFTSVAGAGHTWLWDEAFGQSNQDLWSFLVGD
jgi:polyhydroxybutyrate depolymerase